MKLFALIEKKSSDPNLDRSITPYHGHVFCGEKGGWGGYIVSGTPEQLAAIERLPQVYTIAKVTDPKAEPVKDVEPVKDPEPIKGGLVEPKEEPIEAQSTDAGWAELDVPVTEAVMTKINDCPIIKGSRDALDTKKASTNRDTVLAIFKALRPSYELAQCDVMDAE